MSQFPFRPARATARSGGLALAVAAVLAVVAAGTPAQASPVEGDPARVDAAQGAQAQGAHGSGRTGAADNTTYKIVPYVIADPELGTHTGRLVRELRRHGDLDRFGIQPATSDAAQAAADQPVSYVTDSGRFPNGSKPTTSTSTRRCRSATTTPIRPRTTPAGSRTASPTARSTPCCCRRTSARCSRRSAI